jgi:uncharacterized protein (UPF0212 family)
METKTEVRGEVYCPICTHVVPAQVIVTAKTTRAKPGQKCPRCSAPLDAGYVVQAVVAA